MKGTHLDSGLNIQFKILAQRYAEFVPTHNGRVDAPRTKVVQGHVSSIPSIFLKRKIPFKWGKPKRVISTNTCHPVLLQFEGGCAQNKTMDGG